MKRTVKAWAWLYPDGGISGPVVFHNPNRRMVPVTIIYDDGKLPPRRKRKVVKRGRRA